MAFFGLTALGYQNTFAVSARTASNLHVFDEKDFRTAWRRVKGESDTCRSEDLQTIFRTLFHGPVPQYDAELLSESFDGGRDEIGFDDYMSTLQYLKELAESKEAENEGKVSDSCDFTTSSEFGESLKRNKRPGRDLQQKQQVPLTSTQEIGWEKQDLRPPVAGREGSHITKFAAELVKNGIYY
eukprot:CAMPEP_0116913094 /NCGR_PEP_ID=MMETSP0467-20121206/16496_1 /TAXON_ID=283647 /ORGANISM="Mesodinium pulex, Strain SPMC105" /LENGTH=183 /DNA_ID=CAMNT_0004589237 /DNA_START=25 /DNA_END=576 /DNA_ORIENTATION=-